MSLLAIKIQLWLYVYTTFYKNLKKTYNLFLYQKIDLNKKTDSVVGKVPRPPPLRPNCKEYIDGLKRSHKDDHDDGPTDRGATKKTKTDDIGHTTYRENYTNFLNYLTTKMEINYKMKRARG